MIDIENDDDFMSTATIGNTQRMYLEDKRRQAYDRGHHIFDAKCFCGKMLKSYQAEFDHYKAKHPKMFRKMKKLNIWEQLQYDWRVHPEQVQAKISRNNSFPAIVSNK